VSRPARWWRLAVLLYRQARLIRGLRRQLVEQQESTQRALEAAEMRRIREVLDAREKAAGYRDEAISLDYLNSSLREQVRRERANSNAAWREVGRLRLLADHPDMPAHLAELIRSGRREGVGADA
jgi:hypothetical protein